MIELFLDNKPAVLRDNASIKLTRENAYFTKCGSYTYDVELPLQCVENRAIFGSINRKDVATIAQELHAVLRVDNVVLLDGKAVVNHVTDSAVKVQLLGGNSEMNFYAKGSELFIDELDLGDWMNEVRIYRPDGEPIEHFRGNCLLMAKREQDDMLAAGNFDQQLQYLANRWWKTRVQTALPINAWHSPSSTNRPTITPNRRTSTPAPSSMGTFCEKATGRRFIRSSGGHGRFRSKSARKTSSHK